MMTKSFLALFVVLFTAATFACEVHLPQHLLLLGDAPDVLLATNHTECNEETLREVNNTITSVEGKISSFQFAEILKSKNQDVTIQPNLIQVQHLKHLVREQLMMPAGVQMKSSEAINAPNYITLAPGDKVEVQCIGCLFGSQQPMNVNIQGFDGGHRTLIVRADFKKMVKAYRLISFQAAFSEVSKESLKEEYVEIIPHTDLVTNLETLKYYKLNKPMRAGELLRQSDLNALNLVKAGVKTEVVIENALIMLKTSGISRSNGTLGEMVEVFHPQKNKKYLGKVIDINKVLVEL